MLNLGLLVNITSKEKILFARERKYTIGSSKYLFFGKWYKKKLLTLPLKHTGHVIAIKFSRNNPFFLKWIPLNSPPLKLCCTSKQMLSEWHITEALRASNCLSLGFLKTKHS